MRINFFILFILLFIAPGCSRKSRHINVSGNIRQNDSTKILYLLNKGEKLYAQRQSMSGIGESLLYFDSAYRLAQRLGDTAIRARTSLYIGNVYNAWNGEPQTTIKYYAEAEKLFERLPGNEHRPEEFYLRYILAHSYDGEKANDSVVCVSYITGALNDYYRLPVSVRDSMDFVSDFAWVATNINNYSLAEHTLHDLKKRPVNNSNTNNYLDHYFLTKARIGVYKYNLRTVYLDSLQQALKNCNNRFDSAYYLSNLASMFAKLNDFKNAWYFLHLNAYIQNKISGNDILTGLRNEIEKGRLESEKEDLKIKNLYLAASGLVLLIIILIIYARSLRYKRRFLIKQSKQQAQFTKRLLQQEEIERKRVAMELHDGINHDLLVVKNNLILGNHLTPEDIDNIISSIRAVSHNLYPAVLETVGLQLSLEALCRKMTEHGIFTTCEIEYSSHLPKEDELQLYRITQEALQNVSKHSGAEACKISLSVTKQKTLLEIRDNGCGMKPQAFSSFGLQTMRERAKGMDMKMTVSPAESGSLLTFLKISS